MTKPSRKERQRDDPLAYIEAEAAARAQQPAPSEVSEEPLPAAVAGIQLLPPSRMIPDRFQPRPLMPLDIANAFFEGELDCYEAAASWLKLADKDPAVGDRIEPLLNMADTFDEHGQIKAITGSFVPTEQETYIFQIETGERRFWAACLQFVKRKESKEPMLRVEVIDQPTRYRQVIENRHAEPPTAVAQSREIAALLLEDAGTVPDPGLADPYDYFRQALKGRRPHKTWPRLETMMQLSRRRMSQLLDILRLPTPLLEQADLYNLPERVLREVLARPENEWEELINVAIEESLTADQIAELAPLKKGDSKPRPKPKRMLPAQSAMRGLRTFARSVSKVDEKTQQQLLDEMADEMMVKGEAHTVLRLIEELGRLLRARVERS